MKNNTPGNTNQTDYVSQTKRLSFYEENYILEPADFTADNHYFDYEGDFEADVVFSSDNYLSSYEVVA